MKPSILLLGIVLGLGQFAIASDAQTTHHTHHRTHHKRRHHYASPKNTITQLRADRKKDHTVRQITPDPKKSPGKHADNLSKNVNHEVNRESKGINHFFQGKKK